MCVGAQPQLKPAARPPVLAEIDRQIREGFYDPRLKGVDWNGAVAKAAAELSRSPVPSADEQNAIYDRLLATLQDSHTFRVPPGRLPEREWGTTGLRIGRDGDGYAVKGVIPGSPADKAGLRMGDRILAVDGRPYGKERVNFRDLFFVLEGTPKTPVAVTWQRPGEPPRTEKLAREYEEPGDRLVWNSAKVTRRNGKAYGYARLWGMSAETALAVLGMLLDREEVARARPNLAGWGEIEGFLLDVRGNSGGYEPDILPTFLRGQWNSGDYYLVSRDGKRLSPPAYKPLPVALLVNSGTASAGESLALKFRAHRIGPIVGEETAGMASGGAAARPLPDGSMLWYTARAIEGLDGRSYEGRGVQPDVAVKGDEDAILDRAIQALESKAAAGRKP
ncbi:MAG: S41 family peptidase [Thermoanaerobaculia bacterium]